MYIVVIDRYYPDDATQYSTAYGPFENYNDAREYEKQHENSEDFCSSEILAVIPPEKS